jgi:hypothetical protein
MASVPQGTASPLTRPIGCASTSGTRAPSYSIATQLLDEALPARASLRGRVENWRARWLHPDFSVVGDHIRIQQQTAVRNPERLLELFEFILAKASS